MTLYNLRTALDDYRITKFTKDLDVESSYIMVGDSGHWTCECPAGTRSTCRHRQMLRDLLPLVDTEFFWDFERHTCVDADGNPSAPVAQLVEQVICNDQVAGSIPVGGTTPATEGHSWRRI